MKTNIPTYRAKKIGTENEWVEGYYIGLTPDNPDLIVCLKETPMCPDTGFIETYVENIEIDPNTLTISFDNGETFDDINECKKAIDYVKGLAEIWKD